MNPHFPPLDEQSCRSCRYHHDGQCRRQSPRVLVPLTVGVGLPSCRAVWPHTYAEDWCGEFCPRGES